MRRSTAIMAMYEPETQEGEALQFELCKGGYFSDHEEYGLKVVGATAQDGTPTPDTPVPIQCVKAGTEVRVCGKNLLSEQMIQSSNNNRLSAYTESNGDRWINLTTGANYYLLKGGPRLTSTLALHITVKNLSGHTNKIRFDVEYDDGSIDYGNLSAIDYTGDESEIKTTSLIVNKKNKAISLIRIASTYNGLFAINLSSSQIELGSTAPPYEPYYDGGTVTLPCDLYEGDIFWPMTGVVERNTRYIDVAADCVVHAVRATSTAVVVVLRVIGAGNFAKSSIKSNRFKSNGSTSYVALAPGEWSAGGYDVNLAFDPEIISNEEEFQTWLVDNPVVLVVRVKSPTTKQYAPSPIHAPAGVVNVLQTPAELPATLSATMLVKGGNT